MAVRDIIKEKAFSEKKRMNAEEEVYSTKGLHNVCREYVWCCWIQNVIVFTCAERTLRR